MAVIVMNGGDCDRWMNSGDYDGDRWMNGGDYDGDTVMDEWR
jgi:hypothetical protein